MHMMNIQNNLGNAVESAGLHCCRKDKCPTGIYKFFVLRIYKSFLLSATGQAGAKSCGSVLGIPFRKDMSQLEKIQRMVRISRDLETGFTRQGWTNWDRLIQTRTLLGGKRQWMRDSFHLHERLLQIEENSL